MKLCGVCLSLTSLFYSHSIMLSRSIHTVAKGKILFFLQLSGISLSKKSHSCIIHSSTDGHLGCFYILVIVNNAAMNIEVLMFFWISVLHSFGYIPRTGIAGSKCRSIFNFLSHLPTDLHSGCTNLHSHQSSEGFPFLQILASTFC